MTSRDTVLFFIWTGLLIGMGVAAVKASGYALIFFMSAFTAFSVLLSIIWRDP